MYLNDFTWIQHVRWYGPLDRTMITTATSAWRNCCKMRPGHQFLYVSALCVSQLLPFQGHLSGCCWPLAAWRQTSEQRQALCFVPSKLANNPRCALVEVPAAMGEAPFCSESPGFSCLHCVQKLFSNICRDSNQKIKTAWGKAPPPCTFSVIFDHNAWTNWPKVASTDTVDEGRGQCCRK